MSIIYPGNYVAQLSSYQNQGVESTPGVAYYSARGYAKITSAVETATLVVASPDRRADDKPRPDKALVVPAGAFVYQVQLRAINLKRANNGVISATNLVGANLPGTSTATANLTLNVAAASGDVFSEDGNGFDFRGFDSVDCAYISADKTVGIDITGDNGASGNAKREGTVEPLDASKPGYILVEVNYALETGAPTLDQFNIPYETEN